MTSNTDVFGTKFAFDIFKDRYSFGGTETWRELSDRTVESVCGQFMSQSEKNTLKEFIYHRQFIPAGRYLYAAGRESHMIKNCYAFRAEDTREGWGDLLKKITITSMLGGGCATDYSNLRGRGTPIKRTGGVSSGPMALIHACNEAARYIRQGGSRRAALGAWLVWNHPDIYEFMMSKNWDNVTLAARDANKDIPLPLELTNISVVYNTDFFTSIEKGDEKTKNIWNLNCLQAFKTGEPGFSFNHVKDAFTLRNPCGEFVTDTDSDSCNLGTVFISKFKTRDEFEKCVKLATKFLICGTAYSDYPTQEMKEIAFKNNRIGLGLGGVHEWLIDRGYNYSVPAELHKWLNVYERGSDESAYVFAREIGMNIPLAKRAIAPTGTIGCLSESTTGIEPIFCKAYKRHYYNKDQNRVYQYVIDPVIRKAIDKGIDIKNIEDSYDLDFTQRVKLQADIQQYVDMAISSTINLPEWGSEKNNESTLEEYSKVILKYAKRLRGLTTYPNNSRGGQPLERVSLEEALTNKDIVFESKEDSSCKGGVCGV